MWFQTAMWILTPTGFASRPVLISHFVGTRADPKQKPRRTQPVERRMADLPPRLTTSEVCALGRFSTRTFRRRVRAGKYLLQPCDRGVEDLWKRDEVLRALGMTQYETPKVDEKDHDAIDPEAFRAALAGQVRQRPGPKGGRDIPGAVRSARPTAPLRLAFDATAAD